MVTRMGDASWVSGLVGGHILQCTQSVSFQAIVFYGTDFELTDLPLPRKSQHLWTLTHEESPKNNILFSFKGMVTVLRMIDH